MAFSVARRLSFSCWSRVTALNPVGTSLNLNTLSGSAVRSSFRASSCHNQHLYKDSLACHKSSIFRSSLHNSHHSSALSSIQHTHNSIGIRWISTTSPDNFKKKEKPRFVSEEEKLGLFAKFKLMYKRYWYVLLPVHCATSVIWYGGFFLAAKTGVDIVPLLQAMGVTSDKILCHLQDSNAGYYAIAYAMYKVATPARYTVTLGCTTFSINYLRNTGYIKPVPTKEQLREMYEDKKEEMREKTDEMREKFEGRREEFREKFEERRDEMRNVLDERRKEFKERFASQEMMDRLENKKDELRGKIDRFDKYTNIKDTSSSLKSKLKETKDMVSNLSKNIDRNKK